MTLPTLEYATMDDLRARLDVGDADPDPEHADVLLPWANGLVTQTIQHARFTLDAEGFPAPQAKRDACKEAALRQVSTWLSTGVNPATSGVAGKPRTVTSRSALGVSESFANDPQADGFFATLAAGDALIPSALQPLQAQGLTTVALAADGAQAARPFMRHYPWPEHPVQYIEPGSET